MYTCKQTACTSHAHGQHQQDYKSIYSSICNVNIIRNIYNYAWDQIMF